jgi:hypothetical protein
VPGSSTSANELTDPSTLEDFYDNDGSVKEQFERGAPEISARFAYA